MPDAIRRYCVPVFVCLMPLWLPAVLRSVACAQTSTPLAHPPTRGKTRAAAASATLKTGVLAALDATAETLTLKDSAGQTAVYHLTGKTRFMKAKHPAQAADFKVGDTIIVHLRAARNGGDPRIVEVADPATWSWLRIIRRDTLAATITQLSTESLTATVGADATPLTYTLSEKTRWNRAGKEAGQSDFKAGDKVFIVPHSLPGGGLMARAVSDSPTGAARLKEQLARSIHGVVQSLDGNAHKITLLTAAGAMRVLPYRDTIEVRRSGKTLPMSTIQPGQRILARLKRDTTGEDVVWRITIEKAGSKISRTR